MARRIDSTFDAITGGLEGRRDFDIDQALRGGSAPHHAHQLARCNDVMAERAEEIQRLRILLDNEARQHRAAKREVSRLRWLLDASQPTGDRHE